MDEITFERFTDGEERRQGLKVTGSVTIAQASLFKDALLGALEAADELQVDLSGVSALDLTGLQLLCAAHQSAEQAGKRFQLTEGGNETFIKVVGEAGFRRHVGCSRDNTCSCIWVGGEK